MKQNKKNFLHESLQDSETLVEILKSITTGVEQGEISFSDENNAIVLKPHGLMQLKVSATQDSNRHRFNIKVSWQLQNDSAKKSLTVKSK